MTNKEAATILIDYFKPPIIRNDGKSVAHLLALEAIAKAVDALEVTEVVRCKDCKHYTPFRNIQGGEMDEGECEGYDPCVPANHFCSRGERKEEI